MIRIAQEDDAKAILDIYTPYVVRTAISFENNPPTLTEMRQRILRTLQTYPWLVYERAGSLTGYAYASAHRSRLAYQWSVDTAIYVDTQTQRSGVGRTLYTALFALLRLQGFYNAYAGIAQPNPASVGLHEAVGFQAFAQYNQVGFKLGRWHDVGWWHLELQPKQANPVSPTPFATLERNSQFIQALQIKTP